MSPHTHGLGSLSTATYLEGEVDIGEHPQHDIIFHLVYLIERVILRVLVIPTEAIVIIIGFGAE